MISRFINRVRKLVFLLDSIEYIKNNEKGDIHINFKQNVLISSPKSIGIYCENNLILESDLLAQNTLKEYGLRNLESTASLMFVDYDFVVNTLPSETIQLNKYNTISNLIDNKYEVNYGIRRTSPKERT